MRVENYRRLLRAVFPDKLDESSPVPERAVLTVNKSLEDMGRYGLIISLKYGVGAFDEKHTWDGVGEALGLSSGYAARLGRYALHRLRSVKYSVPIGEALGMQFHTKENLPESDGVPIDNEDRYKSLLIRLFLGNVPKDVVVDKRLAYVIDSQVGRLPDTYQRAIVGVCGLQGPVALDAKSEVVCVRAIRMLRDNKYSASIWSAMMENTSEL